MSIVVPVETILIIDDGTKTNTPAVFLSSVDGSFITFSNNFPFGEDGFVQKDGHVCCSDANNFGVAFFDKQFNQINTAVYSNIPSGITGDRKSFFYVLVSFGGTLTLNKYQNDGTFVTSYTMPTDTALDPIPCCISRDDSTFYYANSTTHVNKINLNTMVNTTFTLGNTITNLEIDINDIIYASGTVSTIPTLQKYDSSFNLLNSVTCGPAGYSIDVAAWSSDDISIWCWTQKSTGPGVFQSSFFRIKCSDLSVIKQIIGILTDRTSSPSSSISPSCPILVTSEEIVVGHHSNDCGGGSLVGGTGGGGGSPGCQNCADPGTPLDPSLPTFFLGFIQAAGANGCWDIGIINAIVPSMEANSPAFFPQLNSAGQARGRFYKDAPDNYGQYVDTNKGCLWAWVPHGF